MTTGTNRRSGASLDTPLARLLSRDQAPKPDALTAFKVARRWFRDGRRIEMQELAQELGVSRATLFRWVGSRDDLLGEVIVFGAKLPMDMADEAASGLTGGERVAAIMQTFCELVLTGDFFREFLRREPERALRILTTRAGPVQGRMVAAVGYLIQREIDEGHLPAELPLPLPDLAYLVVRILESFLYSDLITGEQPDPVKVGQAVRVLLPG
jgi:AcrR family transcriptional regulator